LCVHQFTAWPLRIRWGFGSHRRTISGRLCTTEGKPIHMTAFALTFAIFAALWLVGLGLLAAIGADTRSLRLVLTAPALGSSVIVLGLFLLSYAGVAMNASAPAGIAVLLVASALALALRRPPLPRAAAVVIAVCLINLLLVGRPLFTFGFHWIANANNDMANYVLSATKLLHHGLLGSFDVAGLAHDRDYATAFQGLQSAGARPGAEITLSGLAAVTGRPPYEVFMPLILALNLSTICAAGALALQAARRSWVAILAAGLLAVSPLSAFGVLQQLLPQVWGLGLAAAMFALLMREELHGQPGPSAKDVIPIALLAAAFTVTYIELMAAVAGAYLLYVLLLAIRRRLRLRSVVLLWAPPLVFALLTLNGYLLRELRFVETQSTHAVSNAVAGVDLTPLFGFALVPSALPGILGLQKMPASYGAHLLSLSIILAIVALTAVGVAAVLSARRGMGAASVLVADLVLGVFLASKSSDFGVFKLYMYVQPFLAAAVAVWIGQLRRRWVLAAAAACLALLVAAQLRVQAAYVAGSRDPIDLRNASSTTLLPAFRRSFAATRKPVVAVTDNPTLAKLEAASVGSRPLYLVSQNIFASLPLAYGKLEPRQLRQQAMRIRRLSGWKQQSFPVAGMRKQVRFEDNTHASRVLMAGNCAVAMPTGSELPLNRRSMPEGSRDLEMYDCRDTRDLLVFTASNVGEGYYLPRDRRDVALYQLEHDYFYQGRTMAGMGRFALFRVLRPSSTFRLEVTLTTTLMQDGSNLIPPATVVGATRVRLPEVGRGSARLFSPPLRPRMIAGQPYVLLDMGERARLLHDQRPGVQGLFGRSFAIDPRYLTSYVRDISIVSTAAFRTLRAPATLAAFPAALANPDLEYSGIYEDGWVAEDSYMVLAGGRATNLVLEANALPLERQRLDVIVDGREVASKPVKPGNVELRIPLPPSKHNRRVELRWARTMRLAAGDKRPAAARLIRVSVAPAQEAPRSIASFPSDLSNDLDHSGIWKDGWLSKDAHVVLAGGRSAVLTIKAAVPPRVGGQHLEVLVNGDRVASKTVTPGSLVLRIPLRASRGNRRIKLRWAGTVKLQSPDNRQAAAQLKLLELSKSS
jgi:hypothetical protein